MTALIVAMPDELLALRFAGLLKAANWETHLVQDPDRVAWKASVLRPSIVVVVAGAEQWTSTTVAGIRAATSNPIMVVGSLPTSRSVALLTSLVDLIVPAGLSDEEFLARVAASSRRAAGAATPGIRYLEAEGLTIDFAARIAKYHGIALDLGRIEFTLLAQLASAHGRVVSTAQLAESIWGADSASATNALRIAIRRLRLKLHDPPRTPTLIISVKGVGYRFGREVVELSDSGDATGSDSGQMQALDRVTEWSARFSAYSTSQDLSLALVDIVTDDGLADAAAVHLVSNGAMRLVAHRGMSPDWVATAQETPIRDGYASVRALQTSTTIQYGGSATEEFEASRAMTSSESPGLYLFLPFGGGAHYAGCLGVVRRSPANVSPLTLAYLRAAVAVFAGQLPPAIRVS